MLLWIQSATYEQTHATLTAQLLELILIPLLSLVIVALAKLSSALQPPSFDDAVDYAIDFALLGTGATGSVFANDTVHRNWGDWVTSTGIATVLVCLVAVFILMLIKKWDNPKGVKRGKAIRNLAIGSAPLALVAALFSLGYNLHS